MKLLSLFSGIGAFEKALDNINVEYDLVNYCEIDKYASKAYSAIHNVKESKNLWDIGNINPKEIPKDLDLMTYGFPCQDISIGGELRGFEIGSQTRSSLLWKAMEIVEEVKPKVLVAENVDNLISKKFIGGFRDWLDYLNDLGYDSYFRVLNSCNFGVPQHRRRVFIVSILKEYNPGFSFKEGEQKENKLKEILNTNFDEKYLLNDEYHSRFIKNKKVDWIKDRLPTSGYMKVVGTTQPITAKGTNSRHWVHDINHIVGALSATGYKQPKQIYLDQSNGEFDFTLRKLTPLEYWKLMGFDDQDYQRAKKRLEKEIYNGNDMSDTRMYKMAGNSIVVPVLESIFKQLFKGDDKIGKGNDN
ncbi:MAG: DNA cytosine methyltransferase [bacterium]